MHDQEGMQASFHRTLCELDQKNVPFLCRLRMDCRHDQDNIFLQEYRRVVTVVRQEDIGVDVHDKRCPMPFMCGSSHKKGGGKRAEEDKTANTRPERGHQLS